jgi:ketosteroid isomerase-like protein
MTHPREEVEATVDRYCDLRERIERGEADWTDLAQMFTDDVVFIDPAWGRVEGIDELRTFLSDSMKGLEDWSFPIEFTAIDGDDVVIKWVQLLPGTRPDGSRYQQSGCSTLIYAGDGKFRYEEDLLNMSHVLEDLAASGWRPGEGFNAPPPEPNRDFSRPGS